MAKTLQKIQGKNTLKNQGKNFIFFSYRIEKNLYGKKPITNLTLIIFLNSYRVFAKYYFFYRTQFSNRPKSNFNLKKIYMAKTL